MMLFSGSPPDEATEPLARSIARAGVEVLDRVIRELPTLPARAGRPALAEALTRALEALGGLAQSGIDDTDHLDLLRAAIEALDRARAALAAAEVARASQSVTELRDALAAVFEPTLEQMVERQRTLFARRAPAASASLAAPVEKPTLVPFGVSVGTPRLCHLDRAPLPLVFPLAPRSSRLELDDDLDDDDLDDDAAHDADQQKFPLLTAGEGSLDESEPTLERELFAGAAAEAELPPAEAELRGLGRIARDVIDEIGVLGLLRARSPREPDGPWAIGPASFEERLLKDLDALVALAMPFASSSSPSGEGRLDVLALLLEHTGDGMAPDPARAFARAFTLGSFAGEDTARAAVRSMRRTHPMTHAAQRDALALAPHPGLAAELAKLCADAPPRLARVALEVLQTRREASFEVVAPLLSHPTAAVRAAAARCLSVATPSESGRSLLEAHAQIEEDESTLAATAEGLLILGSPAGLRLARAELEESLALADAYPRAARMDFVRLLAIAGSRADSELLFAALDDDAAVAEALGFHGDAGLVPTLLDALARAAGQPSRAAFGRALARALHRITGLGRAEGNEGKEPIFVVEPPPDPAFWRRRWQEHHERFAAPLKYRFGGSFSPAWTIAEAETDEVSTATRQDILLELAVLSRGASRVEARDWIARQKAEIAILKERFQRAPTYPAGQWLATALGR